MCLNSLCMPPYLHDRLPRHELSFRGEELILDVYGVAAKPVRLLTHSNETLQALRDMVACKLDVSEKYLTLTTADTVLQPDMGSWSLGELGIFPDTVLHASLTIAQDTVCPPYVPPAESDPAMERLLPGFRLVSRQDFLERLFELAELPFSSVQRIAAKLLQSIPSDPVEHKKLSTRVRIGGGEDSKLALQAALVKIRSPFRRLYNMELLASIILSADSLAKAQDASVLNFRQAFLEACGLQVLVDVLAKCNEPGAYDSLEDNRAAWTVAASLLQFLTWKGIHVDVQVLHQNVLTLEIPQDKHNEHLRKMFQEQKSKVCSVLFSGINSRSLLDSLLTLSWRASLANWSAKTLAELSTAPPPPEGPQLPDMWLAQHTVVLLCFLLQTKPDTLVAFADMPLCEPFLRDVLLQCKSHRIRALFAAKFVDLSRTVLARVWPAMLSILSTHVERNSDNCTEFFGFLTQLLPAVVAPSSMVQADLGALLQAELTFLKVLELQLSASFLSRITHF